MTLTIAPNVRSFIISHRVARLATADKLGAPHVIPICYEFHESHFYSAIDRKPKRSAGGMLKRVRNIRDNPHVAIVIDDYSEQWSELAYVMIQGSAAVLDADDERHHAESLLRQKYTQYQELLDPGSPVLKITVEKIVSWGNI